MKRSELYTLVWQKPLRTLAPELGLSDVGLGKLCKRYDIPVPGLGHWARVAAGQKVPVTPLPDPTSDPAVRLPTPARPEQAAADGEARRERGAAAAAAGAAVPVPVVELRQKLDDAHPLVVKTAALFRKIEAAEAPERKARPGPGPNRPALQAFTDRQKMSFGRYLTGDGGELRIAATLKHADWILRYHDALLRGLESSGCAIAAVTDRGIHRIEVRRRGEALNLTFAEEFKKSIKPTSGVGRHRGETERVEWTFTALKSFKLKIQRGDTMVRQWIGTAPQLEAQLPLIVHAIAAHLEALALERPGVEARAAAARQRRAEEEAAERRRQAEAAEVAARAAARAKQRTRASGVADAVADFRAVLALLAALERRADELDPSPGADVVRTWAAVVRAGLADPVDALIEDLKREAGGDRPPLWWPDGCPWPPA